MSFSGRSVSATTDLVACLADGIVGAGGAARRMGRGTSRGSETKLNFTHAHNTASYAGYGSCFF